MGHFVEVNWWPVVQLGGSQHSGDRVSLRGHRSALMGAVGTDLRERVRIRAHSINGFYLDFLSLSVPVPLKQQTIL